MPQKPQKNPGGRPRKNLTVDTTPFAKKATRIRVKMTDRKAVEALCESQIEELQNDFAELKSSAKFIVSVHQTAIQMAVARTGVVPAVVLDQLESSQSRLRQIMKDQSGILAMLMKQFELFSGLEKPTEDDPLYTPVIFNHNMVPPPEAIVENQFELEEDDVQPDRPEDD